MTTRKKKKSNNRTGPRGKIRHYRGFTLHSDLELDVMKALYSQRRRLKRSFSFEYETECLEYVIEGTYTPDFIIKKKNGTKIYVECKGYLDAPTKKKMLAVRRNWPEIDIRFLFEKNNKISKNSKMRYVDWAIRNGFNEAAVGREIPEEWLTE